MTNKTKKWIRAGLETFIHGATSSVASNVAIQYVNPLAFADWPSKLKVGAMCFALNGGLRLLQWWNSNPLPPEDDDSKAGAGMSLNPLSKVQPISAAPAGEAPSNQNQNQNP